MRQTAVDHEEKAEFLISSCLISELGFISAIRKAKSTDSGTQPYTMNAPSYETRRKERLAAIQKQRQELEQMELRFKSKHQTWLRYVARLRFHTSTSAPTASVFTCLSAGRRQQWLFGRCSVSDCIC